MDDITRKVDALLRLCTATNDVEREQALHICRNLAATPTKPDRDTLIQQYLMACGVPDNLRGKRYLMTAIALAIKDPKIMDSVTGELYPAIAQRHNTTASKVERAMRAATCAGYQRASLDVLNRLFGHTVSAITGNPTNSGFIAQIANEVRRRI